MRIEYIVSTMVFWWRENRLSLEQECQFLQSLGFGVELWPNIKGQSECRYDKRNWTRLVDATKTMSVVMRSRDDNPTLEQWREQIECAKLLGANIVTDMESFGILPDSEINGCDFSEQVVEFAESNNIKLCLETGNLAKIKKIGDRFESIYYCLDTGFANLDSAFTFKEYVDELAPRLIHLHLTDNYGKTDDHEPPGLRGGISRENWEYLLNKLEEYDNYVIGSFEMCPCMPAVMIRQANEFLFEELNWPNPPQKQPGQTEPTYHPV